MFRSMMLVPALAAVLAIPIAAHQGRGRGGQGPGRCEGGCAKCTQCDGCQHHGRNWQGNRGPMNQGQRGQRQQGQEQTKPAPAPEKK